MNLRRTCGMYEAWNSLTNQTIVISGAYIMTCCEGTHGNVTGTLIGSLSRRYVIACHCYTFAVVYCFLLCVVSYLCQRGYVTGYVWLFVWVWVCATHRWSESRMWCANVTRKSSGQTLHEIFWITISTASGTWNYWQWSKAIYYQHIIMC